MRMQFNRMEWAGSVGDLGTLLPLAFALIMINGLAPGGLFLSIGLLYIFGGLYYQVPIAVQPMKVVAAYAVAQSLSAVVITASGMLMAAFLLVLGSTGLANFVARMVPQAVIRGVQMTTGVLLLRKGVHMVIGNGDFQQLQGRVEPFLSQQSFGPVPMSLAIGIVFAVITFLLLNSKKYPAGLVVVLLGCAVGAFLGAGTEFMQISLGLHMPVILPFGMPTGADFSYALLVLVLPQVPMTMGNAVIANRDLSFEYFGKQSRRVTDRALCMSMGLGNVVSSLTGGMPLCHGAGGLAAHYRFGARTSGSNMIIGGAFVLLAVLLGADSVNFLHMLPMGVLGVLLFFSGSQLALTIMDVDTRTDLFVVVVMLGIALASNLAWAFGVGICLHHAFRKGGLSI